MSQHVAVYVRVSSSQQTTRSQEPDLKRWLLAFAGDSEVRWYRDNASGSTMDRHGWTSLEAALRKGDVSRLVVWRIDRLGRTASGLTALFEDLARLRVGFVSTTEGLDLGQPSGRLIANVMAAVAAYEREVRGERQAAGIAAAKSQGKTWGGRKPGSRYKVTREKERTIRKMAQGGETIAAIARVVELSRPTVYSVLASFSS